MMDTLALIPKEFLPIVGDKPIVDELGDEICVKSSTFPVFFVFFPRDYAPSQAEVCFISKIVAQPEKYTHDALRYLREHPLTETLDSVVATDAQFSFYPHFEFNIFFQECNLPTSRNGVIVGFRQEQPYEVSPIEDPDAWWDDESGTWIPG